MTINSKLPKYREEVANFTDDKYVAGKAVNLAQRAFADGVASILEVTASKNKTNATKDLNENLSDFYVERNFDALYDYFLGVIDNVSVDDKLILNYQEVAKKDFKCIIKAIYDMGLIAGTEIAKDPKQLSIFLENREKIESGKY